MKLGENLLRQKNIMHVSLPVTIFKPEYFNFIDLGVN